MAAKKHVRTFATSDRCATHSCAKTWVATQKVVADAKVVKAEAVVEAEMVVAEVAPEVDSEVVEADFNG